MLSEGKTLSPLETDTEELNHQSTDHDSEEIIASNLSEEVAASALIEEETEKG